MYTKNIKLLLCSAFTLSAVAGLVYPYMAEYIVLLGGDAKTVGLVFAIRNFINALLLIPGGYLADTIGRKKLVVFFTFLFGLANLAYFASLSWQIVAFFAIIEGITYLYFPAFNAILMDSTPKERLNEVFLIAIIMDYTPYAIMPIIGGFLRDTYGIYGIKSGFFLIFLLSLMIGFFRLELDETLPKALEFNFKQMLKSYLDIIPIFKKLSKTIKNLIILRSIAIILGYSMFYNFAILYATRVVGLSFTEWGILYAISSISFTLSIFISKLMSKIPMKKSYVISLALQAIAPLMFLEGYYALMLFGMILSGLGGALAYSIERSIVANFTIKELRGRAEALMELSFSIGGFLGSFLGGIIYSISPKFLLGISSILMFLGSIASLFMIKDF
ncbi:MAG: MFS transporter [Candidatus Bathyarchaeia archaeon]